MVGRRRETPAPPPPPPPDGARLADAAAVAHAAHDARDNCAPEDQCLLTAADVYLDLVSNSCILKDSESTWASVTDESGWKLVWFAFTTVLTTVQRLLAAVGGPRYALAARQRQRGEKSGGAEMEMEVVESPSYTPPQVGGEGGAS